MRCAYVISRVVINNLDSRIAEDVVVFFFEIARHDSRYQRFDFAYHDPFNARIQSKGSRRNARAESDDQHRTWSRVIKRREMAKHSLHLHVARSCGCLDLSANVKVPG